MEETTHVKADLAGRRDIDHALVDDERVDQSPPPDHDEWLELAVNGRRATRRRWEMRKLRKLEREAADAGAATEPEK